MTTLAAIGAAATLGFQLFGGVTEVVNVVVSGINWGGTHRTLAAAGARAIDEGTKQTFEQMDLARRDFTSGASKLLNRAIDLGTVSAINYLLSQISCEKESNYCNAVNSTKTLFIGALATTGIYFLYTAIKEKRDQKNIEESEKTEKQNTKKLIDESDNLLKEVENELKQTRDVRLKNQSQLNSIIHKRH